jgi:L-amino acid N-acyltransferase YncA
MTLHIRPATEADLPAILDIYNEAVIKTVATFDTALRTMERQREWWEEHRSPSKAVRLSAGRR